jgi:hypothetical protein
LSARMYETITPGPTRQNMSSSGHELTAIDKTITEPAPLPVPACIAETYQTAMQSPLHLLAQETLIILRAVAHLYIAAGLTKIRR